MYSESKTGLTAEVERHFSMKGSCHPAGSAPVNENNLNNGTKKVEKHLKNVMFSMKTQTSIHHEWPNQ